jgi:hypothetical protein
MPDRIIRIKSRQCVIFTLPIKISDLRLLLLTTSWKSASPEITYPIHETPGSRRGMGAISAVETLNREVLLDDSRTHGFWFSLLLFSHFSAI